MSSTKTFLTLSLLILLGSMGALQAQEVATLRATASEFRRSLLGKAVRAEESGSCLLDCFTTGDNVRQACLRLAAVWMLPR